MIFFERKRRLIAVFLFGMILCIFFWQLQQGNFVIPVLNSNGSLRGKTICIDPGHGGRDPGAIGGGLQEKHLNLDMARKTASFLRKQGAKVILTRNGDQSRAQHSLHGSLQRAELFQRSRLPDKIGAEVLISIHCNSEAKKIYYGPQTFFEKGNSASSSLARAIQKELLTVLPSKRRAVPGEYYLLKKVKAPAVIVEVGYLSHPGDAKLLASPGFRTVVAEAIGRGVVAYFGK